jgi:DNA-binding MarR family transcriptional regulator
MERIIKGIWIPIEIWQDKSLSWNEKILLMEIDSFTSKGHDCYISNEYIADLLGVTERSASRLLSHLLESGLIRMVKFDGRKRYVESTISFKAEWTQMSMQGGQPCLHTDNNEYININNNTLSNKETGRFKKPSIEEIRSYCLEKSSRVDPEQFFNFYESNGWMVGKNHMKDWRAAVRTWEKREKEVPQRKRENTHKESVLEHNLKVMDELFGTDLHKQAYGNNQGGDIDEQ